ncbi:MAG: sortase [Candidatus Levybacteria bacterium]|nr:sortase [Candidatus Levybacteria bacterium]
MTKSEILKYLLLRTIGNFLLLFALFGVAATFGPALYFEVQYQLIKLRGVQYTVADVQVKEAKPQPSGFGQLLNKPQEAQGPGFGAILTGKKEQVLVPKDTQFSIVIPKIGATSQIAPNIDPANEQAFLKVLQTSVAHAKGTVFPGMKGNIYLFAHSTDNFWDVGRYNAIFYLLKDLAPGDEIVVFFENRRHNYVVTESKIVDPTDVSYLVKGQESGQETLILQTCWPPGTTWKRLLVFAKPK